VIAGAGDRERLGRPARFVLVGTREQLLRCYPQFRVFLEKRLEYDFEQRFQSDWYRHYRELLA
jgi:hypothetical protein